MNDHPIMLVVAAALIDQQGRVLLQQRPPGKAMAGLWEFPGGKVEPGETPEAALVRELAEELGISVVISALNSVSFASEPLKDRHLLLLLYICHEWQGTPIAYEASALGWLFPSEMLSLAMPPADRPLVRALQAYLEQQPSTQ